ncbi:hypothetical protein ES707_10082 [subsurface metagenome]
MPEQTGWGCRNCGIWYSMRHETGELCPKCNSKMYKTTNPTEEELQSVEAEGLNQTPNEKVKNDAK